MEMNEKKPKLVFVSGRSGSGKTALIERLIPPLLKEGIRVGTIKHAHGGFEMDHRGKDSFRHTEAGAKAVAVVAPKKTALLIQTEQETSLAEAVAQMAPHADLILVEGYKEYRGRKILLEPAAGDTVRINHDMCRIGVRPEKLSPMALERIVAFSLARAPRSVLKDRKEPLPTSTEITVHLLLFAQLKEMFGEGPFSVSLPAGSTGRAIQAWFLRQKPRLEGLLQVSRLAVNCEYASWDQMLQDGDEVVVIVPVSGG